MIGLRRLGAILACFCLTSTEGVAQRYLDDLGNQVDLPGAPARLVSLAPSNTELLFELGVGDRLVGVTEFCNFPEPAKNVERVAGYSSMSLEKIVAVEPDLVVAARGNDLQNLEALRSLGFPVFALDIQSVSQLIGAAGRLGKALGATGRADSLQEAWRDRLHQIQSRVDTTKGRPKVMWGYWGETVYTAGAGTAIDDVIRLAGGFNVGESAPGAWPQVSLETVISWSPDVIITTYLPGDATADVLEEEIDRLRQMDGWGTLPAVLNGRIYYLPSDWLMRPGPRLLEALEMLADKLNPSGDF